MKSLIAESHFILAKTMTLCFLLAAWPATAQNEECLNNCNSAYEQCNSGCATYACVEECRYYYEQCMESCPCNDWVEVSRTLIGRRYSGSLNILGVQYCRFEEYYLVEEANVDGCYPNRTVCDYDDDIIFYSFGYGSLSEGHCCNSDPGDENYCGGDTTTC